MTPEEAAEASYQITERSLREGIATTKQRLMFLTNALEALVAKREEKIAGTAEFIRSLRASAGQDDAP